MPMLLLVNLNLLDDFHKTKLSKSYIKSNSFGIWKNMKKTSKSKTTSIDELKEEYSFDYSKARKNPYADILSSEQVIWSKVESRRSKVEGQRSKVKG